MEKSKTCFKCSKEMPLSNFYKHPQMGDGHLNKCKYCTRSDTKKRIDSLIEDPAWLEKEKSRQRQKAKRLGYNEKYKITPEEKRVVMKRYRDKYPEKVLAKNVVTKIPARGERHHWSYNKEHWKDIIDLPVPHHAKAHCYMIYDQERMMYRRSDTLELLDTKKKHLEWITWCIENKPD